MAAYPRKKRLFVKIGIYKLKKLTLQEKKFTICLTVLGKGIFYDGYAILAWWKVRVGLLDTTLNDFISPNIR